MPVPEIWPSSFWSMAATSSATATQAAVDLLKIVRDRFGETERGEAELASKPLDSTWNHS